MAATGVLAVGTGAEPTLGTAAGPQWRLEPACAGTAVLAGIALMGGWYSGISRSA